MPKEVTLMQAEIEVALSKFIVTNIPTATSGSWFPVHDACEIWGAVAIDLNGEVVGWRCPPKDEFRQLIEEAIKEAFELPEGGDENDKTNVSPDSQGAV